MSSPMHLAPKRNFALVCNDRIKSNLCHFLSPLSYFSFLPPLFYHLLLFFFFRFRKWCQIQNSRCFQANNTGHLWVHLIPPFGSLSPPVYLCVCLQKIIYFVFFGCLRLPRASETPPSHSFRSYFSQLTFTQLTFTLTFTQLAALFSSGAWI